MRGLDDEETPQTMMDGPQIYYNFLRPQMALDGKTPAQKAKLVSDTEQVNWAVLIKKASKAKAQNWKLSHLVKIA